MLKNAEKLGGTILKQEQSTSTSQPLLWNHAVIPPDTDLSSTPLEVILDVATGGYVATCGPLNALCLEANFYQLWTREYVQHLGDYLLEQSRRSSSKKTIIIDVGAGDGLLTQCLRDYMIERSEIDTKKSGSQSRKRVMRRSKQKKKPPTAAVSPITTTDTPTLDIPTLVATDDTSWGISVKAKVEKLSVEQALQKYAHPMRKNESSASLPSSTGTTEGNNSGVPTDPSDSQHYDQVIVLCSWMPMGQDWTALFRDSGVDEYILIGEADDGSCGHNWWTWGNPAFAEDDQGSSPPIPPYEEDGYIRWDMDVLTPFQFSSFDCKVSKSSKTVSFRKTRKSMA